MNHLNLNLNQQKLHLRWIWMRNQKRRMSRLITLESNSLILRKRVLWCMKLNLPNQNLVDLLHNNNHNHPTKEHPHNNHGVCHHLNINNNHHNHNVLHSVFPKLFHQNHLNSTNLLHRVLLNRDLDLDHRDHHECHLKVKDLLHNKDNHHHNNHGVDLLLLEINSHHKHVNNHYHLHNKHNHLLVDHLDLTLLNQDRDHKDKDLLVLLNNNQDRDKEDQDHKDLPHNNSVLHGNNSQHHLTLTNNHPNKIAIILLHTVIIHTSKTHIMDILTIPINHRDLGKDNWSHKRAKQLKL